MMNLFEMMQQAQNGTAQRNIAQQFGLTPEQAQQALEALLPAFSASLKQNTREPEGLASFMQALGSGQHAQFYEDQTAAFTRGQEEGKEILGHLFGSKDASRAVASQAARATGIGQGILKQMLPVIASMVMGGLFKQSTQSHSEGGGLPDMLGDIMGQMMGGGAALGGAGTNPLNDMLGQMMKNFAPQDTPQGKSETAKGEDIFGQMFDAGREIQEGYGKGMEGLVESYMKSMNRGQ